MKSSVVGDIFSNRRNLVKIILDILGIKVGFTLAIVLRHERLWLNQMDYKYYLVYTVIYLTLYVLYKEASKSWSYTNSLDVLKLIWINLGAFIGEIVYFSMTGQSFSRSIVFGGFMFVLSSQLFSRYIFRLNRSYKSVLRKNVVKRPILIYGGGEGGATLIRESITNLNFPYTIVGIIDDDKKKRNTYINGIKVLGNIEKLPLILSQLEIEVIIIAIPSIEKKKIKAVVDEVKKYENIDIKILPSLDDMLYENGLSSQIRDVSIEDLLGREQVLVNGDSIRELIEGKTVFVTGGAGSIGSELARQIARYNPKKLVTIDVNENAIYFLELELKRAYPDINLVSEICNIRERDKVDLLFSKYRPSIVFHAAAHKHVPLMEHNPEEAIKNNIFGTQNLTLAADKYDTERFVLISTDKAVNPTNIMGATKRGCELVVEHMNKISKTKFMAVRFGNVLGSNGSVIPIFKKLIEEGKNLTLTHPDITRYFMTIPEAAQLVMEAGTLGNGGEVFILDMGEPIKIIDLARSMIKLSNADVDVEIVGLRPGEKLYEELLYDVNSAKKTSNKKIFITQIDEGDMDIHIHIAQLKEAVKIPNRDELKALMKQFIVSYREPDHHKKQAV
ncbi:nucleoside-diphosphate sugar epimerase/dehydratase [Cetobacterium sp. 2A]|uniref:polysaccharide biosynthesis protein n=1 Tax=Cetobacterium sp. 2A TaxID=2754723 RepID=UPI001C8DFFF3|nr:nucleoside-diphosphate sugar epimerase/dehydratase [Cetobacterium sp. 2A]